MAFDLYQSITDRIISQLEEGVCPWHKPWMGSNLCISHVTGKPYSLLNQILLEGEQGEYLTFNQCREEGGHVKKGEKSKFVVFWKWLDKKDDKGNVEIGPDGNPVKIPYLRYYNVFHIDQCEGIDPHFPSKFKLPDEHAAADQRAEEVLQDYITRSGVTLESRMSSEAYYRPLDDHIVLPKIEQFKSTAEYYSTAFHESVHSTGHSSRLNRLSDDAHFGSKIYSREELIAEMGAACLVNHVGLETASSFQNSAAYIHDWLSVLKDDKKMIVVAAGKAEKAVKLILGEHDEEGDPDDA